MPHKDLMTSDQLARTGFNGVRKNQVARMYELWEGGDVLVRVSFDEEDNDPGLFDYLCQIQLGILRGDRGDIERCEYLKKR